MLPSLTPLKLLYLSGTQILPPFLFQTIFSLFKVKRVHDFKRENTPRFNYTLSGTSSPQICFPQRPPSHPKNRVYLWPRPLMLTATLNYPLPVDSSY